MKKTFLLFGALLALMFQAFDMPAADVTSGLPPYVSVYGGAMRSGSFVQFGRNPKEISGSGYICTVAGTGVSIAIGDAVVLSGTASVPFAVSKTATACDPLYFGVAITAATSGNTIQIMTRGIAKLNVGGAVTYGQKFATSAVGGVFTSATNCAELMNLSTTANVTTIAARAMESKTYTASTIIGQVMGW